MAVVLALTVSAAVSAEKSAQWNGYYCTSGNCGINFYNYNYGFNTGYYCSNAYLAPFRADFVRDVTYPDGTYVAPGTSFKKTWRLRNAGTQSWTTDMSLVYIGGDAPSLPSVKIPYTVYPGSYIDLSVNLTAPTYGGTFSGQWMLKAPDGTLFGVGCNGATPIWVSVSLWSSGGCSCLGQPVCSCNPCTGANCGAPASYRPGRNPYCNNKIRDIKDVTIPDGTIVAPGATFRKTWSMKNGGTCVWDENYLLSFFYGDDLGYGEPVSINVGKGQSGAKYDINRPKSVKVYPGDYVTISVDLTAPTTPGMYESYFKLRDNLGYEFGFGSYADAAFWVNIIVDDKPTTTAAAPQAPEAAQNVPEALVESDMPQDQALGTENVPEAETAPSEPALIENAAAVVPNKCGEQTIGVRKSDKGYEVLWSAVNAGSNTWDNYTLVKSDANPAISLASDAIAVPLTAPGETADILFDIDVDETMLSEDPLWIEFYMNSGDEGFCEFYFEIPTTR